MEDIRNLSNPITVIRLISIYAENNFLTSDNPACHLEVGKQKERSFFFCSCSFNINKYTNISINNGPHFSIK